MTVIVHKTAVVDEGAVLGDGCRVWHFTHICAGARIGAGCSFGQNVYVGNDVSLGSNVKVQNNVSIYTGTTIEDDVFLGPSCVLTNVTNPRSQVNRHSLYEKTLIRRGATVGANATIICGVTIGEHAFIGAGAVVGLDVAAHAIVVGVPAAWAGWACRCGERLPAADSTQRMICARCGDAYKAQGGGIGRVEGNG